MAESALHLDRLALLAREHDAISAEQLAVLERFAARRLGGEPVARIVGTQEFYGLAFGLNAATLVPRPETELLVDLALETLPAEGVLLDLGTGSGCIPIAILVNRPLVRAAAVDLDAQALEAARSNAARHGVGDRLMLLHGSWFAPLAAGQKFDLIVSNPPYIETAAIAQLQPEVRGFDPPLALDGGDDGLAAYRIIATEAVGWLKPGGRLLVEIGSGQGPAVAALFAAAGLAAVRVKKDLAGLDRTVAAYHL